MSAEPALHVEVEGSGPVVVLGHGFAGSARNFLPQARALRDRYRIVRFDARGHARSGAPAEAAAYTPEAFVADVGRVLDQVGAQRAVVGGLSMGAGIALRFALAHPERVRALVLAAFPPGAGAAGTFAAVAHPFAEAAARLVRTGFLEHPPHGLAHTLRGVIATRPAVADLAPRLAALALPVLLIVGANDRLSLGPSRELAAAAPRARLVVVEGAGHVVNLAEPAAFNAALEEFL